LQYLAELGIAGFLPGRFAYDYTVPQRLDLLVGHRGHESLVELVLQ
jgi:hypothetical protein